MVILCFFSFWIKKYFNQIWHAWAIIILWGFFLNNIFFIFSISLFFFFYFYFYLFWLAAMGHHAGVFLWVAKFLRTPILREHLRWLLLNISRNLELEKRTDQSLVTQNLLHGKQYCISIKKKLLKQCQKEVIHEYILAFAGWWSIFWEVVGGGGYILARGGW